MIQSLVHRLKNLIHAPARILSVLERVLALDPKIDDLSRRLQFIEAELQANVATTNDLHSLQRRVDALSSLVGSVRSAQMQVIEKLADAEFRVFSQFGDDGIIDFLVSTLQIEDARFIEFGVETYQESNTRFLMENRNWSGLIIDASPKNVDWIRSQDFYWRHDLTAVCAFVDASNINRIIEDNGFSGSIGLLSIDIDGNDYWVWKAINVIDPTIVVCEFNSSFGADNHVSIPYSPTFDRASAHYSHLYFGASLGALCHLAEQKGFAFIGCNSAGNNAYFVRNSHVSQLKSLTPQEGYVASKFRESRAKDGTLTFASTAERKEIISDLHVVDVRTQSWMPVKHLWLK